MDEGIVKIYVGDFKKKYMEYNIPEVLSRNQLDVSDNIKRLVKTYDCFVKSNDSYTNLISNRGAWKWNKKCKDQNQNQNHVRTHINVIKNDPVINFKAQLNKLTDSNYDNILKKMHELNLPKDISTDLLLSRCIDNNTFAVLYIRILKDIGYSDEVILDFINKFSCPNRTNFTSTDTGNENDSNDYDNFCALQKTKLMFTNLGFTIVLLTKEKIINANTLHSININVSNEINTIKEFSESDVILSIYLNTIKFALIENLMDTNEAMDIINHVSNIETLLSNKCKFIIKDINDAL